MDEKDLINWSNLSIIIAGNRQNLRKTKVRPIYQQQVDIFLKAMREAMQELRRYEIEKENE